MTKAELLELLDRAKKLNDSEAAHAIADHLLLEFIDDVEVTEAFRVITKWYS